MSGAALDRLATLQALRDVVLDAEAACDRERDVAPAGGKDADEPSDAALVDEDVRDRRADVDDRLLAALLFLHAHFRHAHGTSHRERHEVDADGLELGRQCNLDHRVDHRALRGDEDHAQHPAPVLLELRERIEVQNGFFDRHRDELLRLEPERGPQLLLGQPRQGDLADDHALVADAHVDLPALEPASVPELAERLAHDLGLADLAGLDRPLRQGHLGGANDDRGIPALELGGAHRGRADVQADANLRHLGTLRPDRSLFEEALEVGLTQAVVLAHTDGGQLPALDQPIDRHVGHAHRSGHLRHGQEAARHERLRFVHPLTVLA